ncbi:MAG: hypothetical protein AVDCRST_MAG68-2381, partial [uncultured Gemmatimonadetes bacterium]
CLCVSQSVGPAIAQQVKTRHPGRNTVAAVISTRRKTFLAFMGLRGSGGGMGGAQAQRASRR